MENTSPVVDLEVVEDLTANARCDEGFLRLKRLRCRNRRADGTTSAEFRVDVVDRPTLDAVAVLIYRHTPHGVELLLRAGLRPAAYFRSRVQPGASGLLHVPEIVAGTLEPGEIGVAGIQGRGAAEVREEAGIEISPQEVVLMGAPFFPSPGILSERIHLARADVTGKPQRPPPGDGSPLEEDARLTWWKVPALLEACRDGRVPDAKTELALARFLGGVRAPG